MKNLILFIASALIASSFFCFSALNAQIVYTDVDPDTTVYMPDTIGKKNYYYFDVNHDSIDDFCLVAFHQAQLILSISISVNDTIIDNKNIIMGPLRYLDTVSNNNNFVWLHNTGLRVDFTSGQGGDWFNNIPNDSFAYCGFKLIKDNITHFGWIRLKVFSTQYFTVDGYAYNTIPEQPIVCGQITTSSKMLNINDDISITTLNNNLIIKISDPLLLGKTVNIINSNGTLLKTIIINNLHEEIAIDTLTSGIYFIEIKTDKSSYTKKIFIA